MKYYVITFEDTNNRDLFLSFVEDKDFTIMQLSKSIIVKCEQSDYDRLVELKEHDGFEAMYHGALPERIEDEC
jgi:hypothetical protein